MKEYILELAGFMLLASTFINIIPGNSYKSYVKLFLGLVLIINLLSIVPKLLDFKNFNINVKAMPALDRENIILGEFNKEFKSGIDDILKAYDYKVDKFDIKYKNDYTIDKIEIYISKIKNIESDIKPVFIMITDTPKVESPVFIEIKEKIARLYQLDKGIIYLKET